LQLDGGKVETQNKLQINQSRTENEPELGKCDPFFVLLQWCSNRGP